MQKKAKQIESTSTTHKRKELTESNTNQCTTKMTELRKTIPSVASSHDSLTSNHDHNDKTSPKLNIKAI
jgi:CHASE3 domain sensor protein